MGAGSHGGFGGTKGSKGNYTIHKGRQDKHVQGSNNYKQQVANGKSPSILTENPSKLLKEGAGKEYMSTHNKEAVDYGRVIGEYYDIETGKYYDTTRALIHYDEHGNAHIVPARPKKFKQ